MYFEILLVIHVLGAIAGIGPTFAFSILGPNAGKAGPDGSVALLGSIVDVQKKIVTPVALVTQPVTGILLIYESGRAGTFFQQEWLVVSIVLYATILGLSYLVNAPAMSRVIHAIKEGRAGTPEFVKSLQTTKKLGPLLGIMTVAIVILMVWKPGDGPFS